ncbi:hypothetical protein MWN34_09265 [Ancylobacter sp. 6x-1]|uniref:Uncharacterized protein n=2 Tax=Ancylobacter crimeensis TaxID=2579147 RepID=A0ABT0DAX1_9HYPH|nr:hypothetical protein [Ancylobacter crimeensis]
MSAEDNRDVEPGSERWERSQQNAHWRQIGISAVAAAARYTSAPDAAAPVKGEARSDDGKVVTLRDIEFFAA